MVTWETITRWALRIAAALFIGWLLWLAVAMLPWVIWSWTGD